MALSNSSSSSCRKNNKLWPNSTNSSTIQRCDAQRHEISMQIGIQNNSSFFVAATRIYMYLTTFGNAFNFIRKRINSFDIVSFVTMFALSSIYFFSLFLRFSMFIIWNATCGFENWKLVSHFANTLAILWDAKRQIDVWSI